MDNVIQPKDYAEEIPQPADWFGAIVGCLIIGALVYLPIYLNFKARR